MFGISYGEIILKLVLSTVLGGIIGFEREVGNRPAGLKTHILVSIGATLIMLVSKYGFGHGADPARLAAQVVSGIGFLGAGTILRTGNTVQGLTTAASLWVCAGIGLAIGSGFYFGAVISVILVMLSLVILVRVEISLFANKKRSIKIVAVERAGLIGDIGTFFGENDFVIKKIDINPLDDSKASVEMNFIVDVKANGKLGTIVDLMYNIDGIQRISLD